MNFKVQFHLSLSQDCACVHTFPSYSLKTALRENCVFFFFKYQPEERKPYSQESNLGFSAQFAQAEWGGRPHLVFVFEDCHTHLHITYNISEPHLFFYMQAWSLSSKIKYLHSQCLGHCYTNKIVLCNNSFTFMGIIINMLNLKFI